MGSFYRVTREEIANINRKADTWGMESEKWGFHVEPIATEEGRGYTFYKNLRTGIVYVDDRGLSSNRGMFYNCKNEREEKKTFKQAVKKADNNETIEYPVIARSWT